MRHDVKIKPEYFEAVATGRKNFELRYDDRNYQVDDEVCLMEWDRVRGFTGRHITVKITYILRNCTGLGLETGFCIFSFKKLHEALKGV